jgi:hypothetical protein
VKILSSVLSPLPIGALCLIACTAVIASLFSRSTGISLSARIIVAPQLGVLIK